MPRYTVNRDPISSGCSIVEGNVIVLRTARGWLPTDKLQIIPREPVRSNLPSAAEVVTQLRCEVERLANENRALKESLAWWHARKP